MNIRKLFVSVSMLAGVLFSACVSPSGGAPAVTAISPSPTALPLSPTAVTTSAQTTISPNMFKIPVSITYGPDWRYVLSNPDSIQLKYLPSKLFIDFLIVDDVTLLESGDPPTRIPFPDDFEGYLQSTEFWSEVTPVNPVSISGVNGYQIDAIGNSSKSSGTALLSFDSLVHKEYSNPAAKKFRFFFFDNVSGNRLLIVVGTDDPDLLSIPQFDAIFSEVQEVLDTVTFGG